jgi:hypothetical protein
MCQCAAAVACGKFIIKHRDFDAKLTETLFWCMIFNRKSKTMTYTLYLLMAITALFVPKLMQMAKKSKQDSKRIELKLKNKEKTAW